MRSISLLALVFAPAALAERGPVPPVAPANGFAVERLQPAAPGSDWFALDDLRLQGGLGGAVSLTLGYARNPLVVGPLAVVSDQAMAELGLALTWDRFRISMQFAGPIAFAGQSGVYDGYVFSAPSTSVEQNPDTIADPRIGLDARLLGEADGPLRLGAGLQLIVPSGARADYTSDGDYRALARLLLAGDRGDYRWAAHAGVHLRQRDDAAPGGPRGSELIFGAAGGARFGALALGPEVFGETALRTPFGAQTTGLEALLGARYEGVRSDGAVYRFRLGAGAGLDPRFGNPAFRIVAGLSILGTAR